MKTALHFYCQIPVVHPLHFQENQVFNYGQKVGGEKYCTVLQMWECISSTCNLLEVTQEFVTEPFFIQWASYSGTSGLENQGDLWNRPINMCLAFVKASRTEYRY
ncbi:hypothetical protein E2320_012267 [Naja naja]|nr:hypothetical protein E2320_012267 [Naja naja]